MSELFANPEVLECNLCFEIYDNLCPEHKLSIAFKNDPYLERCVNLLIEQKIQEHDKQKSKKHWIKRFLTRPLPSD